ncbi:MAG: DUF4159 domain-containing protein [Hyphomonadaceae bacterium]|nr:DUF4159 domain-containing protein [Hyphomonadaceae bacterium]
MTLGPITFAAPWALAALAALPILFLVLRASPPPPRKALFPPVRLLLGLQTDEQSRERAPLWLVLLRALMATLAILAFARPSIAPPASAAPGGGAGSTLLVIDDGWTAAPHWSDVRGASLDLVAQAERGGGSVSLLLTAPSARPIDPAGALTAADARGVVQRLDPKPWSPDRADAARRLAAAAVRPSRIVWITDGLADPGAADLARTLERLGPVTAITPALTARAIVGARLSDTGVAVDVARAPGAAPQGAVAAETADGRSLGVGPFRFAANQTRAQAQIALPPEIAARTARVRLIGEQSAGATRLLPGGADHPRVGLADPGAAGQPLPSDLFYVDRALQPFAALQRGPIRDLIAGRAQAIVLPDQSRLPDADAAALERFLERGGLVVRFAGPRLANESGPPLPVALRPGARTLGGAVAWERPQSLQPFAAESPFHGLAIPEDLVVSRMVLAEPGLETEQRVWARLDDGAPIVTAAAHGRGLVVLFHVTGNPDWSNLPLSGLFVDLLRRSIAFSGRGETGAARPDAAAGPYVVTRAMDGFGALAPAGGDVASIAPDAFEAARAGPRSPPGLYARAGVAAVIDAAPADLALAPLVLPEGIARRGFDGPTTLSLIGPLLALALALVALDLLVSLALVGRLPRLPARAAATALALALALAATPEAHAQAGDDPTLELRLAYAQTGDAATDALSREGLAALSAVLRERTAVEPGAPIGVDLARDDLSVYPFIYWPAPPRPQRLSSEALANLDRYMRLGGMLLVDTRDGGRQRQETNRPAAVMLAGLDAPPLEQLAPDHVVSRAFYILRAYPGARGPSAVWAESASVASARDGVASLFVGDGDWAAAWSGRGAASPRQREMALRFGVNLVMVSLTGNYKSDQVHVPALLERLGRER